MDGLRQAIEGLLQFVLMLSSLIVSGLIAVELWARSQLTELHVPQNLQTVLLLAVAVLLVLTALRLFGGLIRVTIVLVLVLITVYFVMPLVRS